MTPERWQHVKSLFESALALTPLQRTAFLDQNCTDPELREEVESLISSHEETGQFLEEPVANLKAFEVQNGSDTAAIGMRLGPWELVEEIGRGGMGTVYLAVRADQEYRKRVAIKLIRRGMETEFAVRRFRNERQILAKLEHPNIARLIDGGTSRDGMPYFVMEYVEGQPLNKYCEAYALSPGDRVEIFLRVCSAVHYAHRRMIVHRDLKPGNILVKKEGVPKLLDFGIAKLLDPDVSEGVETTMIGARIVTPAYASPEQMRGEPATVRSDIFALGVVLFELLTGRRPAQDPSAFEELEPGFRRVISKATRQNPDERYESVESFAADVQRCIDGQLNSTLPDTNQPSQTSPGSVAVLPFKVIKSDAPSDAYLGIGITDALVTKLSNVGRISVRPTSAVMKYTEASDAVAAGRELSVEYIVEGRVQKTDGRVRATVQLVRVRTGTPVWASNFDEELEDLLKVEDSISGQVAQALIPQLTGEEKEQLSRRGTASAKAHQAYLRGRWYWSQHTEDGRAKALISFMQAIADDPRYAQAHAGVADYYLQLGAWGGLPPHESFAAARQAANTALEIDPSLAEAHASLAFAIWACDRDFGAASHEFQLAIALNPDYSTAHHWFGLLNSSRGRHEVAVASLERARKLDPNSPIFASALALAYYNARQFDRAIVFVRGAIQSLGEVASLYEMLAWSHLAKHEVPQALEAARRSAELSGRNVFSMCVLAAAESANGNRSVARDLLAEVESRTATRYNSGYLLASMQLACGDRKRALAYLEQAWLDRDWWVVWVATNPHWDEMRSEPRFIKLIRGTPEPPKDGDVTAASAEGITSRAAKPVLAAVLAVIVLLGAYFLYARWNRADAPFRTPRFTKLTTNGTAQLAAVSPDGSYVAYTSSHDGKPSVYVRALASASPARLAGPLDGNVSHLEFTRRGTHVAFISQPSNDSSRAALYVVPLTGGAPELLISRVGGPLSVSPDGSQVAFLRANPEQGLDELLLADSNGTGERRLATRKYPDRFTFFSVPAWSPDGRRVAAAIEGTDSKGFSMSLLVFDIVNGNSRKLASPRFQTLGRLGWVRDRQGLLVIGQEPEASFQQLWYVPAGRGEPTRLTSDLSDYDGVSLTADAAALVSVQKQTLSNVYITPPGEANTAVQITPGSGRYFDLNWTADGRIGYASDASGSADIWIMNADGSGQRQLTSGMSRSYSPAFSPDGKTVTFHSNRTGNWNLWRMAIDGGSPRQLTSGTLDSNWPHFTPDGASIIYHHTGLNAMFNVWRVPVDGGAPVQLTENLTTHPAVSPVDGRIACWYSQEVGKPDWRLAIFPATGGAPERLFEVAPTVKTDTPIRWTPKGDGITIIDARNGVQNLWIQPVDGSPARAITNFVWGEIFSYDWASDGRLAYSRGLSTSDVVLIR